MSSSCSVCVGGGILETTVIVIGVRKKNFFLHPRARTNSFPFEPHNIVKWLYITYYSTISFQMMWIVSAAFLLQCFTYWTILEGPWHEADFWFDDLTPTCSSQVNTWDKAFNSNLMILMVSLICISNNENVNVLRIVRCIRFIMLWMRLRADIEHPIAMSINF